MITNHGMTIKNEDNLQEVQQTEDAVNCTEQNPDCENPTGQMGSFPQHIDFKEKNKMKGEAVD